MKQTRTTVSTKYEVWYKGGNGRLAEDYDTKLDAYNALKSTVQMEQERGYTPSAYIIVETKWGREYTEDGEFVSAYNNSRTIYTNEQIKKFLEQGL